MSNFDLSETAHPEDQMRKEMKKKGKNATE